MNVDLNNSECIVRVTHIGHDVYHNICTGTSITLDWGMITWMTTSLLILALLFLFVFVVCFILCLVKS